MKPRRTHRGFSIIEILIAVIIIGILTLVLVPTLLNRAQNAKITACQDEVERLAEAERRCAIESGYLARLFVLDDVPGGDNYGWLDPADRIDGFLDERLNSDLFRVLVTGEGLFLPPYSHLRVFIDYTTHEWRDLSLQSETAQTGLTWTGPYFSIRRDGAKPLAAINTAQESSNLYNIPDDPWGHDYLLFMPRRIVNLVVSGGIVAEPRGEILTQWTHYDGNGLTYTVDSVAVFDRPTILSMGPNGIPGDATTPIFGKGDDVFLSFEY
jgi:prepilin-type N-terminal cleavage/methylation domain-containing protein